MVLNKEIVQKAIEQVTADLRTYNIQEKYLSRFGKSHTNKEFLDYIENSKAPYLKFLPLLINKLGLKKIVELGNREGLSTLCIYDKLASDAEFVTIDIEKDQRYCPPEMFLDKRVRFLFGDVSDLKIFKEDYPFDADLIFSDTIHYYFQVKDEWQIYKNFMADTALFAIDDINLNDKRKLFDELPFPKWDLTNICHGSGWGLILYEREKEEGKERRLLNAYQTSAKIWQRKYLESNEALGETFFIKSKTKLRLFLHSHPWLHKLSLVVRGKI